jgi:hypothetical protein
MADAQQTIPQSLNYSTIRPPGIPSRITTQRYNPSTPGQVIQPGDIVRFEINSTGFWDPYNAFFNIDVDMTTGEDNVIYQLDQSAHSFIRYMVIYDRGAEIERIMDYDLLAALLNDVHLPVHQRYFHSMEGIGYANYSNNTFGKLEGGLGIQSQLTSYYATIQGSATVATDITNVLQEAILDNSNTSLFLSTAGNYGANTINAFPNIGTLTQYKNGQILVANETFDGSIQFPPSYTKQPYAIGGAGTAKIPQILSSYNLPPIKDSGPRIIVTGANPNGIATYDTSGIVGQGDPTNAFQPVGTNDGRILSVRNIFGNDVTFGAGYNVGLALFRQNGQYGVDILTDGDVQAGGTAKQVFNYALSNGSFEPQFTNGKLYYYNPNVLTKPSYLPDPKTLSTLSVNYGLYIPGQQPAGWLQLPFNCQYSKPMISNGQMGRQSCAIGSFSIPILSGFLGTLMPTTSYKLIPMSAFPNLTIEMQMSPWAMFTSGYCNSNANSINYQPARKYTISRFELVTNQYIFPADIENIVMQRFRAGESLYFHTHSFLEGPVYSITDNVVPGVVQINLGFDSLKALLWMYIPQDYQTYSWCRRNYRVSHNITKVQAKIGMDYYPSIPSLSNAGNLAPLQAQSNFQWQRSNNEFVIEVYKAFGIYNDMMEDTFLSPQNMAVNNRVYDPDNYLGQPVNSRNGYAYRECFNQYGWPLVHENRCVGRSVFAIDLESLTQDKNILSGINTTSIKPFEIYQEYVNDSRFTFKGQTQLVPFCWYDMIIAVNPRGVSVVGRS